jgi:hypothetical protein
MPRPHDHAVLAVDAGRMRTEKVVWRRMRSRKQARALAPIEGRSGSGHLTHCYSKARSGASRINR